MRRFSFSTEPAVWIGLITSIAGAAVAFGLPLTNGEIAAVVGLVPAVAGLVIRSQVSPKGTMSTADQLVAMVNAERDTIALSQQRLAALATAAQEAVHPTVGPYIAPPPAA